jgi:N-methylhydantoinase A
VRVATDVGGTFTDLVCYDETTERTATIKCDTTPPRFEQGVMDAIRGAGIDPADFRFFVHGTTVVINALTERRGARTGLITTRGFRDVLEIARATGPTCSTSISASQPPSCRAICGARPSSARPTRARS